MDFRSQFVPYDWFNSGYIGSVHSALDLTSPVSTPPPPYVEKETNPENIYPSLNRQSSKTQIFFPNVRPLLKTKLSTIISEPSSPTTLRSSISSASSDTSSISEWSSSQNSSTLSMRTLRRSRRRTRGMSLRDLRAKQSEMDLKKVYSAAVDEYLSGDVFDNFRVWPEPVIVEETGERD